MYRPETELIFLNRGELKEYVNFLEKMVDSCFDTIFQTYEALDLSYNAEDILKDYIHEAKGPTIIESILIKEGEWSEEEVMRNFARERMLKKIQRIIEKNKINNGD